MNYKTRKISNLIFGLASVAMAIILFDGCKLPAEDKETINSDESNENLVEAKESLDEARKEYVLRYEAFKLESDNKIAENEKVIAELKAKAKMESNAAKRDFEKELAVLEQKNQSLKEKMSYYKDEGDDKWESFKMEFDQDIDSLGQALKDLTKNNTN
jgi:thymidylate synthase